MSYEHLHPSIIQYLELSDAKRIEKIRSPRWIGYPQAQRILRKLDDLVTHPKTHRMPNVLLVGDTNNGKTMLVNRFKSKYPADDNPKGDSAHVPVLLIQAPPTPDEGRFYNILLDSLFAVYKPHDRLDKKQFQVIEILKRVNLKLLIIDEIHHILAGSLNRQKTFLNVLKYLGNELQVPIVGVGIKDAFRALQTDPQLANRFEPLVLPRWEFNEDFLRLLASFEHLIPLKQASNLSEITLATRLFSMSEGYIGELSKLLNEAAVYAVNKNIEKITSTVLDSIDWVSPSDRKRQLDYLT